MMSFIQSFFKLRSRNIKNILDMTVIEYIENCKQSKMFHLSLKIDLLKAAHVHLSHRSD